MFFSAKYLLRFFLSIGILFSYAFSALAYDQTIEELAKGGINQGGYKAVARIQIGGSSTLAKIDFKNESTEVPFGKNYIYKVALYVSNQSQQQFSDAVWVQDVDFSTEGSYSGTYSFSGLSYGGGTTRNYFIVYYASKNAPADKSAGLTIAYLHDTSAVSYEVNKTISAIPINAYGVYLVAGSTKKIDAASIPGADMENFPAFEFMLEAKSNQVDIFEIQTLTIYDINSFFAVSPVNTRKITNIILMEDRGYNNTPPNEEFSFSEEKELVSLNLTIGGNTSSEVIFNIPASRRPTLNGNTGTISAQKRRKFYLIYDIGSGVQSGDKFSVALKNGTAESLTTTASAYNLNGIAEPPAESETATYEVPSNTLTMTDYKNLVTYWPYTPAAVIAGQQNVEFLDVELNAANKFENTTWTITNGGKVPFTGSSDYGITNVSIWRVDGTNEYLIGSTKTFKDSKTAEVTGITIPSDRHTYRIKYDFGVLSGAKKDDANNISVEDARCVLTGISGVQYAGYPVPPDNSAASPVTASIFEVVYVSSNVVNVVNGNQFEVRVGIKNNSNGIQNLLSIPIYLMRDACTLRFYENNINGTDISSEYVVSTPNGIFSALNVGPEVRELTFTVSAANIRTDGPVVVDAYIGATMNVSNGAPCYFKRGYDATAWQPAAKVGSTYTYHTIVVSGAEANKRSFPSYIEKIETRKTTVDTYKRFVNNDIVYENSQMLITFFDKGANINLADFEVQHNGVVLTEQANVFEVSQNAGTMLIHNLGSTSGTIYIRDKYDIYEPFYIYYNMNDGFAVWDVYPYPSPYNPDDGECNIGFYCSEAGASYTIYIYDSAGTLVAKSDKLTTIKGYNVWPWDGARQLSGKKVGRGAYLVKVKVSGAKSEVFTTKIGVK